MSKLPCGQFVLGQCPHQTSPSSCPLVHDQDLAPFCHLWASGQCGGCYRRHYYLQKDAEANQAVVKLELEEEEEYFERRQNSIKIEERSKILVDEMKQEGDPKVVKKELDAPSGLEIMQVDGDVLESGQRNFGKVANDTKKDQVLILLKKLEAKEKDIERLNSKVSKMQNEIETKDLKIMQLDFVEQLKHLKKPDKRLEGFKKLEGLMRLLNTEESGFVSMKAIRKAKIKAIKELSKANQHVNKLTIQEIRGK